MQVLLKAGHFPAIAEWSKTRHILLMKMPSMASTSKDTRGQHEPEQVMAKKNPACTTMGYS